MGHGFDSAALSHPSNPSAQRESAQKSNQASARAGVATHLCIFRIGGARFAIDARGVGEVVSVATVAPVPVTKAAIVGIFNLRGHPLALVDLAELLGLGGAEATATRTGDGSTVVMILRGESLTAGARIDAMESVIELGRSVEIRKAVGGDALVLGYLEGVAGVVTILSTEALFERVRSLRSR